MGQRLARVLVLLVAVPASALGQTTWDIDPAHSAVQFSIRHLMISNVEVRDPGGKTRAGAHAATTIKRSDFGIQWNKTLDGDGVVVGDHVAVTTDVEGVKR